MSETTVIKNPLEAATIIRRGFSLSISDNLTVDKDPDQPLQYVNSNLSRFAIFVADSRNGQTQHFKANIPQSAIKGIVAKAEAALHAKTMWEMQSGQLSDTTADSGGEGYASLNLRLLCGTSKGKTVGEFVQTSDVATIQKQIEFLAKNADKYPANAKLVEQFKRGLDMKAQGVAPTEVPAEQPVGAAPVITIYRQDVKPLVSTEKDGLCLVYDIKFLCNIGKASPWQIQIGNQRSGVRRDADNRLQTTGGGTPRAEMNIYSTDEEFLSIIYRLNELADNFVANTYVAARKESTHLAFEQRKAYADRKGKES